LLKQYLGVRKVIWLGSGFSDVETDGHVDNIACFAGPAASFWAFRRRAIRLSGGPGSQSAAQGGARRTGREIEIVCLPQPKKLRTSWSGRLLAMSYVNFYLANGAVIMPAFEDANDEGARTILAQCFPGRDIMQIHALDILQGGGGIHCVTQQEPQV
jgi:agmatine deiminase